MSTCIRLFEGICNFAILPLQAQYRQSPNMYLRDNIVDALTPLSVLTAFHVQPGLRDLSAKQAPLGFDQEMGNSQGTCIPP